MHFLNTTGWHKLNMFLHPNESDYFVPMAIAAAILVHQVWKRFVWVRNTVGPTRNPMNDREKKPYCLTQRPHVVCTMPAYSDQSFFTQGFTDSLLVVLGDYQSHEIFFSFFISKIWEAMPVIWKDMKTKVNIDVLVDIQHKYNNSLLVSQFAHVLPMGRITDNNLFRDRIWNSLFDLCKQTLRPLHLWAGAVKMSEVASQHSQIPFYGWCHLEVTIFFLFLSRWP